MNRRDSKNHTPNVSPDTAVIRRRNGKEVMVDPQILRWRKRREASKSLVKSEADTSLDFLGMSAERRRILDKKVF